MTAKGEPVHPGKLDVEHDRIRATPPDRCDRSLSVGGLLDLDIDGVERRTE
jgi:hypothetical protein